MFARVSTFQGAPDRIDEVTQVIRDRIVPAVHEIGGKGIINCVDRTSGRALTITLWDSEEAMRSSEERANELRSESADNLGAEVVGVDRYEVTVFEVPAGMPAGAR